jgi:MFS family permease
MRVLLKTKVLLIGLWLGAACFFSFAVAPSAFAVLPSRELAGSIVSRTLAILNYSGLIIGLILLAASFFRQTEANRFRLWTERFLLVVLSAACAVGQFVIGLWLAYIRSQINRPIDELAAEDPLRIQFNKLHEYAVWVLLTAMVAALVSFFTMTQNSGKKIIKETPSL